MGTMETTGAFAMRQSTRLPAVSHDTADPRNVNVSGCRNASPQCPQEGHPDCLLNVIPLRFQSPD